MPVTLTPGHVRTSEFSANLNAQYTIRIEAKKRIPFDTLNCLLGMSIDVEKKCDRPAVVRATWVLTSGGKPVIAGSSDSDEGGAWANETIEPKNGSHSAKRAQVSSNFLGRRGMIFATI
jgi:hypothetical protein